MTEQEIIKKLQSEGYDNAQVYHSDPGEISEEHSHDYDTKIYILSGEIRVKILEAKVITDYLLKAGDEKEIFANQPYSAKVGSEGCHYVVAEKH